MNNSVCFGGERSSHVIRHLTFLSSLLTHTSPLSWVMIACIPENKPSQVIWDGVRFWGAKSKNKIAKNKMRRIWNLLSNSKELTKFSFAIPNSKFRVNAFRSYCNPSRLLHQNRPGSSLSVLSQFFFIEIEFLFIYLRKLWCSSRSACAVQKSCWSREVATRSLPRECRFGAWELASEVGEVWERHGRV